MNRTIPRLTDANAMARHSGARTVSTGISWTWATDWISREQALEFIQWLRREGFECRGYYAATADCPDGVKYR